MREQKRLAETTRWAFRGALAFGLLLGISSPSLQAQPRWQDFGRSYWNSRSYYSPAPVSQTIRHLHQIAAYSSSTGRERKRFDNAIRSLYQFQDRYHRQRFDKDKLDQAIEDVQNIVNHNRLHPQARNLLWSDLGQLRGFRANRGRFGY